MGNEMFDNSWIDKENWQVFCSMCGKRIVDLDNMIVEDDNTYHKECFDRLLEREGENE